MVCREDVWSTRHSETYQKGKPHSDTPHLEGEKKKSVLKNDKNSVLQHVKFTQLFWTLVHTHPCIKIITPPQFALLTFQILARDGGETSNEITRRAVDLINTTGKIMVSHSEVGGVVVIRFVPGSVWTEERHVRGAVEEVVRVAGIVRGDLKVDLQGDVKE